MKILHINKYYFLKGGAERYVVELMKLQEAQGHEVAIFAMAHPNNLPTPWSKYFVSQVRTDFRQGAGSKEQGTIDRHAELDSASLGDSLPTGRQAGQVTATCGIPTETVTRNDDRVSSLLPVPCSLFQKLRTAFRMFYSFEARQKLAQLLDDFKPDIVHLHNYHHQLSPSILWELKKRNLPVVQTIHDFHLISPSYNLFCAGKIFEETKPNRYWKCATYKCAQNSYSASILEALEMYWLKFWGIMFTAVDRFVAPSVFVKNKCVEYGVAPKQITVVQHPLFSEQRTVNSEQPANDSRLLTTHYSLLTGSRFVFLGRLDPIKGVDVLLRALSKLKEPPLVDIIGTGPAETSLKKLAQDLNLKNITWHGHKTGTELTEILSSASALVLPTLVYETFGLVILEAATLGLPSIASRLGGITELIDDGKTGWLVKPAQTEELAKKIAWGQEHPAQLEEMGKLAQSRLVAFEPKHHLEKLEVIYKETIKQKTCHPEPVEGWVDKQ